MFTEHNSKFFDEKFLRYGDIRGKSCYIFRSTSVHFTVSMAHSRVRSRCRPDSGTL